MAAAKKSSSKKKAPWDKDNPKAHSGEKTHHLTPKQKASAKRHAKAVDSSLRKTVTAAVKGRQNLLLRNT